MNLDGLSSLLRPMGDERKGAILDRDKSPCDRGAAGQRSIQRFSGQECGILGSGFSFQEGRGWQRRLTRGENAGAIIPH